MQQHALLWAARGFRVFPLAVGSKKPAWKDWDWTEKASADPEVIARWWMADEYNVGVLTTGLIVVDIDTKHGVDGMSAYLDLDLPLDTLIVRTPTGGRHVYFTGPDRANSAGRIAAGIDVRGHHGYVVGPGSALSTGGRYEIDTDLPVAAAPTALVGLLDAPRQRTDTVLSVDLDGPDAVARGVDYLTGRAPVAVEGVSGDLTTFRVAATLKDFGLSQGVALDLLLAHWNERCAPPWHPDELTAKVENAWLYGTSPPGVQSPQVEFAGVIVEPEPCVPEEANEWFDHGDDWNVDVSWLFYKLLPQRGGAMLVGPPNSGKTFVALELARSLATGKPFFSVEPDLIGGTVLLYGGTEGSGLEERLAALQEPERLPISALRIHDLRTPGKLAELHDKLKIKSEQMVERFGVPVRLIVLETLSASGLLVDENNNSEAAQAMSNLAQLGRALNALVVVTHHPPKNGTGERGASAIRGSADYVMEVEREGTAAIRNLELTKARNAAQRTLGSFSLLPVVLGRDGRGREVSSLCVSAGATQSRTQKLSTLAQEWLDLVSAAIYEQGEKIEGRPAVLSMDARSLYKDRKSGSKDASNVTRSWSKQLDFAVETGAAEEFLYCGHKYLALKTF